MFTQSYKNILVGIDGSDQAIEAFKKALAVAKRNDGTVYVANVIDHQFYTFMSYSPLNENIMDQLTEDAKELIADCKQIGKESGYEKIEGVIAYGSAKEAMAKTLPEKYNVDLVMVGQSGLNAAERFMTGSVASYVIKEATCDVLVVHPSAE
ncbi:universal stress protein [Enterococcus hermanniensis]|uniref:Universal stress protein n=1 Tax=Enterococcus hermanniensis TaxID=249189 RepID=A0A1L8TN04_9ENTE|nr:universal stress protein [Enterococcus hermanniensis]OJG45613.1 universal stress protein [Enterococcus hermanniensis]